MNIKHTIIILSVFFFTLISIATFAQTHTVKKGDTVYSIATQYNISVKDVYDNNPEALKGIYIGDNLVIKSTSVAYRYHTIAPKETLYSVSRQYGVTAEQLTRDNDGLSADNFREGRTIRIPQQGLKAVEHTVKAKETLYSISKQYNVAIEDIAKVNPNLSDGLKKGMTLVIPGSVQTVSQQPSSSTNSKKSDMKSMRIGIFLPFLDKSDAQKARYVEYYEGFLLAVEDMKSKGYSMDIYAFDIQSDAKLSALLESNDIKDLHLIIGGVTPSQVTTLANYTEREGIKYVIPFPTRDTPRFGNNSFLVNKSHSSMNARVARVYEQRFKGSNTILLSDRLNDNRTDFVTALDKELASKGQSYTSLQVSLDLENNLLPLLSSTKNNVIVPSSSTQQTLAKLTPVLKGLQNKYPEYNIQLFGYPDWQTYSQYEADFRKLNAVIYSTFYVEDVADTQAFSSRYRTWYGKSLMNTYPKYGMLGYDTGLFFITALARYGFDFENKISNVNVSTLQTAFRFTPEEGSKEYANNGLYFVYYTDREIKKIDCSK